MVSILPTNNMATRSQAGSLAEDVHAVILTSVVLCGMWLASAGMCQVYFLYHMEELLSMCGAEP